MDRERIAELLNELGRRLTARGIRADVFVVGGSAMALAYNARRSTSDVDAILHPSGPVLDDARRMADDLGLPPNWLSEGVLTTMHGIRDDPDPIDWTELSPRTSVRVRIGSPRFLLAMKAMTSRRSTVDLEDAAFLANLLGLSDEEQIAEIVADFWGDADVGSQELFFEDIADRARQLRTGAPAPPSPHARAGSCGHWMPIARRSCTLPAGHAGQHR